jgi:hypothetical protein
MRAKDDYDKLQRSTGRARLKASSIAVSSIGLKSSQPNDVKEVQSQFERGRAIVELYHVFEKQFRQGEPSKSHTHLDRAPLPDTRTLFIEEAQRVIVPHKKVPVPLQPSSSLQADEDKKHAIPVALMGEYRSSSGRREAPRFVNEEDELRDRMLAFGNPYKVGRVFSTADDTG